MGYGVNWNVTHLHGTTITWVSPGPSQQPRARVQAILDPGADTPPRRIRRDGCVDSLGDDDSRGLTVFGQHVWDRPTPDQVAEMAPEYADLMDAFARGRGTTLHRINGDGDPLLNVRETAARIGVQPRTVSRYRHRGEMPEPDEIVSGRPRWYGSTIDAWYAQRPGRGRSRAAASVG